MDALNTNVDLSLIKQKQLKNININKQDDKQLKKVCNDFEAFFMQQLLDISLKNTKVAGEGVGNEIIKGLYTENLSKASAGTLGISSMLYQFLSENKKG